ncbi:helix-turn-helix domain-containing protein [Methyloprofundus sp.]|uniref:helix-turn-helix domain-containing protein n=1 Tax=Methyloprofundus sp. TaxID=2020875 RepID=UPI003D10B40F
MLFDQYVRPSTTIEISLSIIEIAFQLGYTNPANFTRAFNRWAGMSPSKFRNTYKDVPK